MDIDTYGRLAERFRSIAHDIKAVAALAQEFRRLHPYDPQVQQLCKSMLQAKTVADVSSAVDKVTQQVRTHLKKQQAEVACEHGGEG